MNQPSSYAYCHRCHADVNPANYGYNPQDVTAFHIFYCGSCGLILEAQDRKRNPHLCAKTPSDDMLSPLPENR